MGTQPVPGSARNQASGSPGCDALGQKAGRGAGCLGRAPWGWFLGIPWASHFLGKGRERSGLLFAFPVLPTPFLWGESGHPAAWPTKAAWGSA